jgi:pyruvate,water dikinase
MAKKPNIVWFDQINMKDIALVGGKNASIGEMIQKLSKDVKVPIGFATTTTAFETFLKENSLTNKIQKALRRLNAENVNQLKRTGAQIRRWIIQGKFSKTFVTDIQDGFNQLKKRTGRKQLTLAVRSSATAEDLKTASFAGQQETFLNVQTFKQLIVVLKKVFASLYTDRAISYRILHGFANKKIALSAGIQEMVRSDLAASGVMFSIDTESGFDKVVFITASVGLGELVVKGEVNPDEYLVYKPNIEKKKCAILSKSLGEKAIKLIYSTSSQKFTKKIKTPPKERATFALTDDEITTLARYAVDIEKHYGCPMDIEWAKDGKTNTLYIVQARPETVKRNLNQVKLSRYNIKKHGRLLASGRSIGEKIGAGKARNIKSLKQMNKLKNGDVLVTEMTDPDWEPIMKRSSAIVTNRGGRTCHAAIVARELGIPAVVGCENATQQIKDNKSITVSCAEGDTGYVYEGDAKYTIDHVNVKKIPKIPLKIMMNVGEPDQAFGFSFLPNSGVGLARLEFIISSMIGVHPNAILNYKKDKPALKKAIAQRSAGYKDPIDFYVSKIREGVSTIAAAFYPKPVIVRTSDFKTNEYANLIGGDVYEPKEENPMLGFRGASRYVSTSFKACFELECRALKQVRDDMGLTNLALLIPFVRTVDEAKAVIDVMAKFGLKRGKNGLEIYMMCEIPSNVILAKEFLKYFDGFSIGSNDLTQLTLGLDRDSLLVANLFDERDNAVKYLLAEAINTCNQQKKYIGICGQGPSDYPDLAKWLLKNKIQTISLNPDTVLSTWLKLSRIRIKG